MNFFENIITVFVKCCIWLINSWIINLLFFILLFFFLFKMCSIVKKRMLKYVDFSREFSEKGVYENDYIELIEIIQNNSFFPLFFVDIESVFYSELQLEEIELHMPGKYQHITERYHLLPRMQIKRTHKIRCKTRGYYKLEGVSIKNSPDDIFIKSCAEVFVFPKPIKLKNQICYNHISQGNSTVNSGLLFDRFSFSGIRNYMPGDTLTHINFKSTSKIPPGSKGIPIKVNKYDYNSEKNVVIGINFQKSIELKEEINTSEVLEKALSFASYIISSNYKSDIQIGYFSNNKTLNGDNHVYLECKKGKHHYTNILKSMANAYILGCGISFSSLLYKYIKTGTTNTQFYIFTMELDKLTVDRINYLQKCGNKINVISLNDEAIHDEK